LPRSRKLELVHRGKESYYADEDGKKYPRVTSIVGLVLPLWEGIDPIVLEAQAALGTEVHAMCAMLSRTNSTLNKIGVPIVLKGYADAFNKFRNDFKFNPIVVEEAICSRKYKYAGRPDAIGIIIGKHPVVVDYSISMMELAKRLQTAAYAHAWKEIISSRIMIGRMGVQLKENGTYIVHRFDDPNDWYGFLAALQFYRWKEGA